MEEVAQEGDLEEMLDLEVFTGMEEKSSRTWGYHDKVRKTDIHSLTR